MIGDEYKQIVIKSEKAVSQLKWITSDVIFPARLKVYHEQMIKEEQEFQTLFANTMESLD